MGFGIHKVDLNSGPDTLCIPALRQILSDFSFLLGKMGMMMSFLIGIE